MTMTDIATLSGSGGGVDACRRDSLLVCDEINQEWQPHGSSDKMKKTGPDWHEDQNEKRKITMSSRRRDIVSRNHVGRQESRADREADEDATVPFQVSEDEKEPDWQEEQKSKLQNIISNRRAEGRASDEDSGGATEEETSKARRRARRRGKLVDAGTRSRSRSNSCPSNIGTEGHSRRKSSISPCRPALGRSSSNSSLGRKLSISPCRPAMGRSSSNRSLSRKASISSCRPAVGRSSSNRSLNISPCRPTVGRSSSNRSLGRKLSISPCRPAVGRSGSNRSLGSCLRGMKIRSTRALDEGSVRSRLSAASRSGSNRNLGRSLSGPEVPSDDKGIGSGPSPLPPTRVRRTISSDGSSRGNAMRHRRDPQGVSSDDQEEKIIKRCGSSISLRGLGRRPSEGEDGTDDQEERIVRRHGSSRRLGSGRRSFDEGGDNSGHSLSHTVGSNGSLTSLETAHSRTRSTANSRRAKKRLHTKQSEEPALETAAPSRIRRTMSSNTLKREAAAQCLRRRAVTTEPRDRPTRPLQRRVSSNGLKLPNKANDEAKRSPSKSRRSHSSKNTINTKFGVKKLKL